MPMLTEKQLKLEDVTLNYAEGPEAGPPLVLLHGLPGRWQEFLPILPPLMLRWHIFAVDARGQGASGRVPGGYHSSAFGKDFAAFLEQRVKAPAVVLGHSAGGSFALDVAGRVPERVRALILGDSPLDLEWLRAWMASPGAMGRYKAYRALAGSPRPINAMIREVGEIPIVTSDGRSMRLAERPGIDETELRQLATALKYLDPDVVDYQAEGRAEDYLRGIHMDALLSAIKCPMLLIQADPSLGAMMSDRIVEHVLPMLPQATHVKLTGVTHGLGLDRWEVGPLLRVVTAFLETV
ncbi:MAG TPA: alpha/beta hydrolase [Anaerolineales bacterium]